MRGGFCFLVSQEKGPRIKGQRGAHFEWALRHSHARHTAPYHPQPTGGLCQGPCGSGGHCRGRGLPQGDHNGPKEATAGPRHNSSTLPRPRPVGHQSTPWPHQTPTKHPRGPAHHPARLWWPWAAPGVAIWSENSPMSLLNVSSRLGVPRISNWPQQASIAALRATVWPQHHAKC